jgi:hypothetical protein
VLEQLGKTAQTIEAMWLLAWETHHTSQLASRIAIVSLSGWQ